MNQFKHIRFEIAGAIARITLNRPEAANGLDSRLANEMGIFTLPVMLLIDERGLVVNRQIHGSELEEEIEKLVR